MDVKTGVQGQPALHPGMFMSGGMEPGL
jgi:hypothetical protein